jgi:hypothetical protein
MNGSVVTIEKVMTAAPFSYDRMLYNAIMDRMAKPENQVL